MKKFLILTSTLLVLTGCTTLQPTTTPTSTQTDTTTTTTVPTPGNATTSVTPTSLTTSAISPVDQVAYDGALQLKDKSYCDKISDAVFKQQCLDQFNPATVSTSPTTVDCSTISDSQQKDACVLKQQIDAQLAQNEQDKQKEIVDQLALEKQIIPTGDVSKCKTLTLPDRVYDCEMNILIPKAIDAKDLKVCQQASTPEIVKACEDAAIIK